MKSLIILALNLLFVDISFTQPLCDFRGKDSLYIQIIGDTANIWDLSSCAYCSSKFADSVSLSNDSLFILQTDTASMLSTCDCIFDQRTSVVGLLPGTYWVILQRAFRHYKTFFVRSIQFVQPSGTTKLFKASVDSGSLSWIGFQSACITDLVPEEGSRPPSQFALLPNYPNPFNPSTTIQFQIPTTEYVVIKVYDILGREVETLLSGRQAPGLHSIVFNAGQEVTSGIYYYRMVAGSFRSARKNGSYKVTVLT